LTLPAGIQPDEVRVLRKRGVILPRSRSDQGDHKVTIKIEIPKSLSEKQKELIIEAFNVKSSDKKDSITDDEDKENTGKNSGFFNFFKSACSDDKKEKMSGKSSS
jgi:DnaJ-class molecular chaperone